MLVYLPPYSYCLSLKFKSVFAKMSEAAEARRRRILENADKRLKKIKGRLVEDSEPNLKIEKKKIIQENIKEVDAIFEDFGRKETVIVREDAASESANSGGQLEDFINNVNPLELLSLRTESPPVVKSDRYFLSALTFCLALSIRYLNFVFMNSAHLLGIDMSSLHINMIFIPLFVFEAVSYVCGYWIEPDVTFMTMMLLQLNKNNAEMLQYLLKVFGIVTTIVKDASMYFFAFIITDIVFAAIGEESV